MKITVQNITKSFGAYTALKRISMVFEAGAFTTLLGPSGCGKTTLLRIIAGLETPDSGEIFFDDQCVFSSEKHICVPPEKRELGFVFQDFALWPHMTVFENVAFGLRARRQTEGLDEKVMGALEAVRLAALASRYPHQLSGGQQQRVAFARAMAIHPGCILFDEPLSALDAILREEMRTEIKRLVSERGITSVFVTHDQVEAMSMSDKIAVVGKGEILQMDVPEKIYYEPTDREVATFVGRSNWLATDRMVRPENVHLGREEKGGLIWNMKVRSSQFIGDHYEIALAGDSLSLIALSSKRYASGDEVSVFIDEKDIITF